MTGRPHHLQHFDYTGFHRYSLTFCTNRRHPLPDHVHLLVHGQTEAAECKRFIAAAKQYSGYYYSRQFPGMLWQRYGYERTLRKDEDTGTVARYILENPVRAGLARTVEEYSFVGSLVYELRDLVRSV